MSRLSLPLLAISCTLALVGCPGGDDGKTDGSGGTGIPDDTADCPPGSDEDGDGYCPGTGDCDETDANVNPGAEEICDGRDNDCDDEVDEDGSTTYYLDADGDGFGDDNSTVQACEPGEGYVSNGGDCNDSDDTIFPGATEVCDGADNDCDGDIDEDLSTTWYTDADGDGYGDPGAPVESCEDPGEGYVSNADDCNDAEPLAYTGATEVCDGVDNDCNGTVDDGLSTTYYKDADGDGYGDPSVSQDSCSGLPPVWVTNDGDCDDTEPLAWTGATEWCDEVDNDCNGLVDDNAADATLVTADADGDGFGDPNATELSCDDGPGNDWDCDDSNPSEPVVADATLGSSSGAGTMGDPLDTIQSAIDQATDCVVAMAGTYYENVDFGGSDLTVTGVDGWASTIIDAGGSGSVVTFANGESAAAVLDGFTLTNGTGHEATSTSTVLCESSASCTTTTYTYCGGGVYVDSAAPTLANLYVTDNNLPVYSYTAISTTDFEYVYSYGGGICVMSSSGTTGSGLNVHANYADGGGGIYVSSSGSLALSQTQVGYNSASDGAGAYSAGGTLDFTNAILAGNWATTYGGGLLNDSGSSTLWNVTAVGNYAPAGGGMAVAGTGWAGLYSSAVTNSSGGEGVYTEGAATVSASYSDIYGNAGGEVGGTMTDPTGSSGNISADPMYTSWTDDSTDNDDLHPAAGSPLIDAGDPSTTDVDGTTGDIGAYGGSGGGW